LLNLVIDLNLMTTNIQQQLLLAKMYLYRNNKVNL